MENEAPNQSTPNSEPTPAASPVVSQNADAGKKDALLVVGTYVLFFLPLLIEKIKNDDFFRFHMKQSLGLLIASVIAGIIDAIIPFVGGIIQLGVFVLWLIGLIGALKGKTEVVPIIGEYFKKINI